MTVGYANGATLAGSQPALIPEVENNIAHAGRLPVSYLFNFNWRQQLNIPLGESAFELGAAQDVVVAGSAQQASQHIVIHELYRSAVAGAWGSNGKGNYGKMKIQQHGNWAGRKVKNLKGEICGNRITAAIALPNPPTCAASCSKTVSAECRNITGR
jgi:hypothetical protein